MCNILEVMWECVAHKSKVYTLQWIMGAILCLVCRDTVTYVLLNYFTTITLRTYSTNMACTVLE